MRTDNRNGDGSGDSGGGNKGAGGAYSGQGDVVDEKTLKCLEMGDRCFRGDGVKRDVYDGAWWYRLAADRGNMRAQTLLGDLYIFGAGVERDHAEGIRLYEQAAERGYLEAQIELSHLYFIDISYGPEADPEKAFKWCEKAAVQGDLGSLHRLGWMYCINQRNWQEARNCWRKAAEQGYQTSQNILGLFDAYLRGGAEKWCQAIKAQGHRIFYIESQRIRTAESLESFPSSEGIRYQCVGPQRVTEYTAHPNFRKMLMWMELFAGFNNITANSILARLLFFEVGGEAERNRALQLFHAAAEYEGPGIYWHELAQAHLGYFYLEGTGVPQDINRGMEWLRKAAKAKEPFSMEFLSNLKRGKLSI